MVNPVAEIGMIKMAKLLKAFRSKSMKLRILILLCSMSFALMASAQASGGQIARKKPNTSKSIQKGSKPKSVDLGLPSGTLWADRNIGSNKPEDFGFLFAWGETKTKKYFSGANYKYIKWKEFQLTKYCLDAEAGVVDGKNELDLEDDAAYLNWGHSWRIPTNDQFRELTDARYTESKWTTYNNVYGLTITSKINGNTVFLPASGFQSYGDWSERREKGNYWSRTIWPQGSNEALSLQFGKEGISEYDFGTRYYGQSIRPVYMPE